MPDLNRRTVVMGGCVATLAATGLAGCVPSEAPFLGTGGPPLLPVPASGRRSAVLSEDMYGPIDDEPFPVPAVDVSKIDPIFLRAEVDYASAEPPGTIVIDPRGKHLYQVLEDGRATRYGIGVGREGFGWSGTATIREKREWPDWYPPKEMIQRQPEIRRQLTNLEGGLGMPGGPRNPLGARAMYLWQNNKDTLYRIHGTIEPETIGKNVSSGCIRMINQDAMDLYAHADIGTKVVVLA
jgi:lipoprotein-anchoring transpeptidase ErfK/SrfK